MRKAMSEATVLRQRIADDYAARDASIRGAKEHGKRADMATRAYAQVASDVSRNAKAEIKDQYERLLLFEDAESVARQHAKFIEQESQRIIEQQGVCLDRAESRIREDGRTIRTELAELEKARRIDAARDSAAVNDQFRTMANLQRIDDLGSRLCVWKKRLSGQTLPR